MAAAHRHDNAGLIRVREAFESLASDGLTAALVIRRGDEVLLELAAGEDAAGRSFTTRTPVFLYSAVKPAATLCVLLAVADGALVLDAPLAQAWPEFAAHGKGSITLRQALAHGAAVPGWRDRLDPAAFADTRAAADALADSRPWWTPGEPGEHATSYGHLLDAILRRGTGRDISSWWHDLAEAGIGVRLSPGTGSQAPWPLQDRDGLWRDRWMAAPGIMGDLLRNPPELLEADAVNGPVRDVVAPAVTGYGMAHDLAHLWAWWAGAGAEQRLGAKLRDASLSPVLRGHDHVLDREVAWGLGPQVDATSAGMGGVGGTFGAHLAVAGLSVGFTTADLSPVDRADVLDAPLDALAVPR